MTSNFTCRIEHYVLAIPAPLIFTRDVIFTSLVVNVVSAIVKEKEKKTDQSAHQSFLANHSDHDTRGSVNSFAGNRIID